MKGQHVGAGPSVFEPGQPGQPGPPGLPAPPGPYEFHSAST